MDDIFKKASCTNCQDLIDGARIECCECPVFDLCLQCFADGAEIGPHKSNHSYRVIDHLAVRIFGVHDPWTASEHLKLLDAVLGNSCDSWDRISAAVATRTPAECKEVYLTRYVNGNLGLASWANISNSMLHVDIDDQGSSFEKVLAKIPPLDVTFQQAEILGFQPLRDDYERNCYPEAEALVSHLQIDDPSETSIEQSLKLDRINMYLDKLRERHRRKRIIKDYQLVAKYFESLNPTKMPPSPAEQELRDKMRPFARFMNSVEFERLISSLTRERELRKRINHLKKVHDKGLTSSQSDVAITSNSVWPGADWNMLPSSSFDDWKVNLSESDSENDDTVEESGGGTTLNSVHLMKMGSTSNATYYMEH